MFFSIIIPVYNVAPYLVRAVDSVLLQKYSELFEVILIDDGSSDGSEDICDEFVRKDLRVRVVHKANAGQAAARNDGVSLAQGEYIVFLDSDDWLDSDALSIFHATLSGATTDILAFLYKIATPNGTRFCERMMECPKGVLLDIESFLKNCFVGPEPWVAVFRNGFLREKKIRFLEGIFCEDELFTMQVACQAHNIIALDYHGYNYFQSENSTMRNRNVTHQRKLMSDTCFVMGRLKILQNEFSTNLAKSQSIALRIHQLLYRSFLKIISPEMPAMLANEIFNELVQKKLLPLPKWRRDVSYRFYRLLTWLHCPLILLRCFYRVVLLSARMRSIC